jgi:hypothetical protein
MFWEIDGLLREKAGIARTLAPESEVSKVVPMAKGAGKVSAAAAKASKIVIEETDLDDEDLDDFDVELAA